MGGRWFVKSPPSVSSYHESRPDHVKDQRSPQFAAQIGSPPPAFAAATQSAKRLKRPPRAQIGE